MDFGHFIAISDVNQQEEIFEDVTNDDDKDDTHSSSYIPIKVRLEDIRLICVKSSIEIYLVSMKNFVFIFR